MRFAGRTARLGGRRAAALALAALACGGVASRCERGTGAVWIVTSEAASVDLGRVRWSPEGAVRAARRIGNGRLDLELRPGFRGSLRLEAPGACPIDGSVEFEGGRPTIHESRLTPLFVAPRWLVDQGFDRDIEVALIEGCAAASGVEPAWRIVSGDTPLTLFDRGRRARVHTPPLSRALERIGLPTWGIVPLSPQSQGAIELEVDWGHGTGAGTERIRVAAAVRATGIPTVASGSSLHLFGTGWTASPDPRGHAPTLTQEGEFTRMGATEPGRVVLTDPAGRRLAIRFGRYDEMPLDCARADCHREIGATAMASPMTHVFERGLTGAFGPAYDPRCAMACHTLGEPGADDGGFVQIAGILSVPIPTRPSADWFADMPRALRRASGVGCLACHGPAAIPEAGARWSALRTNVCATCHDAPPTYAHVASWRASRMAVSDQAPETRSGECAGCHTTAGFLIRIGARNANLVVPAEAGGLGIACAACHSPHGRDVGPRLVRLVPVPESLHAGSIGTSAICLSCHVTGAANIVFEDGPVASGTTRPHVTSRGCLACHGEGEGERGAGGVGHAFKTNAALCRACHPGGAPAERVDGTAKGRTVRQRASALWQALVGRGVVVGSFDEARPLHADARARVTAAGAPAAWVEAARGVAMVLEDPAAGVHDAAYARALLDEAEALLR